ncbi:MAG TPA: hypothetical protein VGB20_01810 [bacterium]
MRNSARAAWVLAAGLAAGLAAVPAAEADAGAASAVDAFYGRCPGRAYRELHTDEHAWDLHAMFYTVFGFAELEVLRTADWIVDLPLPGRPLHPFQRLHHGVRGGYSRLPKALPVRRFGEFVDAWQIPELSFGDVSATYSVTTGGLAQPGSGTVMRVTKLVDWTQNIVGDVNRLAGWSVRRPQGLITWSGPERAVDGLEWALVKIFTHSNVTVARTMNTALDIVEGTGELLVNVTYRTPHQERTVFLRVPALEYREHRPWITRHRQRIVLGPAALFLGTTHAQLSHRRRPRSTIAHADAAADRSDAVVLMMDVKTFALAPETLRPFVVPAAWILAPDP